MPTPTSPTSDEPIRSRDDLLAPFFEAASASEERRVGPEMEKFGVRVADGAPVAYDREVVEVLADLEKDHGWQADRETEGGPLIALKRGGASVTLEPGGQLELSGAPASDVHGIADELRVHMRELAPVSERLGVRWLGLGFHPFARREDLQWVPKGRYGVMREYLPKRGGLGLDMMLRTCTVQANLDYRSEAQAMRMMRASLKIAPLCAGLFANSPLVEGRPFGGLTMRARVWLDVDPSRTGLLPMLWSEKATFSDYVDWALGAPMFILKRDHRVIPNTDQTFAEFLAHGKDGHRATASDWQLHINTLFPEVRLKRTIEIRSADAQGPATASALPALYAGLFYDERALGELEALIAPWTYEEVAALRERVWEGGLRTEFRGATLVELAQRVVELAKGGLQRRKRLDAEGRDESVHLAGLEALVARGRTPADELLAAIGGGADLKKRVIEAADLASLAD
ncbi:MAG TPA: glutamate-cysteine ligase family protein [Polyangiaceae bacterium]|nr:glutamate-cysteine ligase family protein [Polyangiaceae bacterium]